MITESSSDPRVLRTVGRPEFWESDDRLRVDFARYCASVAVRHEAADCPKEAAGLRCYNCRPIVVAARSEVATHYATFQSRPDLQQ